jgi:hypothetical protein
MSIEIWIRKNEQNISEQEQVLNRKGRIEVGLNRERYITAASLLF